MKHALIIAEDMLSNGYLPVGAVLVGRNKIIADNALYKGCENIMHPIDHAETVALRRLFKNRSDANINNVTLYCTFEPCLMCYATSIISGITNIVFAYEDAMGGGTNINLEAMKPFYSEKNINITPGVCREDSLALFKQYFDRPDNAYAGTILEAYTLAV